ncbi:MAG: LPS export ABC transporter periplasmic protein LptC [Bacillota bacterium]
MKKTAYIIPVLLLIISLNSILYAQEENSTDLIRLKADHMSYEENKIIVKKSVKISRNEYDLSSSYAEIYREENRAVLKEGVEVLFKKGNIKSRQMNAYFDEDRFIFEKEVFLEQELDNGNQFDLKAPYLEMFSEDNSFKAENGVIINYNERTLKSEIADYNGKEEKLVLTENVRIEEKDGWIESNKAEFDMSKEVEKFTADGEVELEFEVE